MTSCNMEERVARALWFDWCDQIGWPNGQPTWDEMATWDANDRNNRRDEFVSLARAAIATINSTPDSNALREALGSIANMPDIRVAREETGFEMRDIARAALLSSDPGRVE